MANNRNNRTIRMCRRDNNAAYNLQGDNYSGFQPLQFAIIGHGANGDGTRAKQTQPGHRHWFISGEGCLMGGGSEGVGRGVGEIGVNCNVFVIADRYIHSLICFPIN